MLIQNQKYWRIDEKIFLSIICYTININLHHAEKS